jgi:hypothetical protein
MIPRAARLLLGAFLMVWVPMNFAAELMGTLSSVPMRGTPAVLELAIHAIVAAVSAAAGFAIWTGSDAVPPLAFVAVAAATVIAVQSLYWSFLPHQTMPGDKLPLALLNGLHGAAWLMYLRRRGRASR